MLARLLRLCVLTLAVVAAPALGDDVKRFAFTQIATNDALGDRHDRWQTASNSVSLTFAPNGIGSVPEDFGAYWELRSGFQIITPENTTTPAAGDRRVAGVLRALLYTHAAPGNWDLSLGTGVESVGPRNRVISLQDRFHRATGFDRVSPAEIAAQIGSELRLAGAGEAAYNFAISDSLTLRPFAEARVGLESYARIGADLLIGPGFDGTMLARDHVTGHPYRTSKPGRDMQVSGLIGADVAHVFSSAFLPEPAYALTPARARLRGGMLVDLGPVSAFYGATYLGPEFAGQPHGQVVGSLQFQLKF